LSLTKRAHTVPRRLQYHVVFIPKYRKKTIFGQIRAELGDVFCRLARQRESEIEEGHLMPDHVHMMISIAPKYTVSQLPSTFRNCRNSAGLKLLFTHRFPLSSHRGSLSLLTLFQRRYPTASH
jgi:REP element-mobilizing transposase RayT